MISPTDPNTPIRSFLISQPGQHCEACLVEETGLDGKTVKAAFKPSKYNPYSFMTARCGRCGTRTLCVAYVGEPTTLSKRKTALAHAGLQASGVKVARGL